MAAPPQGALKIGEDYFSIQCTGCEAIVPVAPNPGREKELYAPDPQRTMRVGCPFCGGSDDYPMDSVKSRTLKLLPPSAH